MCCPADSRNCAGGRTESTQSSGLQLDIGLRQTEIGTILSKEKEKNMLWTVFVILLVLWLLGLVTSYTFGGFVHILLVFAVVVLVIQLIQGRRV
jgi:hypothetical protein